MGAKIHWSYGKTHDAKVTSSDPSTSPRCKILHIYLLIEKTEKDKKRSSGTDQIYKSFRIKFDKLCYDEFFLKKTSFNHSTADLLWPIL